jgi:hypothetical protein
MERDIALYLELDGREYAIGRGGGDTGLTVGKRKG